MEYTKDMIFNVHYDEVNNVIMTKQKWTSRISNSIKRHKFMTVTLTLAVVLIAIDVVLVTNFFRILTIM